MAGGEWMRPGPILSPRCAVRILAAWIFAFAIVARAGAEKRPHRIIGKGEGGGDE